MDLHSLKNEGWTHKEISEELGFHPATIRKWLDAGGPPKGVVADQDRDAVGQASAAALRGTVNPSALQATTHR